MAFGQSNQPILGNYLDQFKNTGINELQWIMSMYPQMQGQLNNAWSMMANPELAIDRFSNRAFQTAARAGQGNANQARWNGLGTGSQMNFINQANQDASGQIGNYADFQYSPEGTMGRLQGLQSLLQPNMTNMFYDLSGKRWNDRAGKYGSKPKSPSMFGQLLGAGAQMAGMGMFGNPSSWFGGGGSQPTGWMGALGSGLGGLGWGK